MHGKIFEKPIFLLRTFRHTFHHPARSSIFNSSPTCSTNTASTTLHFKPPSLRLHCTLSTRGARACMRANPNRRRRSFVGGSQLFATRLSCFVDGAGGLRTVHVARFSRLEHTKKCRSQSNDVRIAMLPELRGGSAL